MNQAFDEELKQLRSHFMEMGIDTGEQIYRATKAFIDHDSQLAHQVVMEDPQINGEEISLEKHALKLMALQQPVAEDFRKVISILKASSDIERLGDYSTHIARAAINFGVGEHNAELEDQLKKMAMIIRQMLERVLDAYVYTAEQAAYEVANMDLKVDLIYVQQQQRIITTLMKDQETIKKYENYLVVLRNLERAGDHIVNLAEWIIYSASGKLVELNPGKTDPHLVKRKLKHHK